MKAKKSKKKRLSKLQKAVRKALKTTKHRKARKRVTIKFPAKFSKRKREILLTIFSKL